MTRRSRWLRTAAVATAALLLAGCGTATERVADAGSSLAAEAHSSASLAAVVTGPITLPALPAGVVTVAGSADALTTSEIRRYNAAGHDVQTSYQGASAGFDALCSGRADLVDSATAITASQLRACQAAGLDVVQLAVAADADVVAIRNETDIGGDCLSTDQARDIFRAASPYTTWSQVGFDDVPLLAGGPGADQDDFKLFDTTVLGSLRPGAGDMRFDYVDKGDDDGARAWVSGDAGWQQRADQANGLQAALSQVRSQLSAQQQKYQDARQELAYASSALTADRQMGASGAQIASDQSAVYSAQGTMQGAETWIPKFRKQVAAARRAYRVAHQAQLSLNALRGRIAVFGFNYYQVYEEQLRPMEITSPTGQRNCIFPNEQTIMNGQYPLARRILLTTTTRSLKRSEVTDFLTSTLSRVRADATAAGLVAVDQATMDQQLAWVGGTQAPTVLSASDTASASAAAEVPAQ